MGATDKGCNTIDGALKGCGDLVVLGVEPSDRPDGLFDMGREEQRGVRVGMDYPPLGETKVGADCYPNLTYFLLLE